MGVGNKYGICLPESGIINPHLAHLCHRVHLNNCAVIFECKGGMKYAGHLQRFSRWGVKCEAFVGKSNLSIAARVRTSGIYLRATCAGNVSHRLHIGFEDSSKSEGVVTRHCHFAESLGIAVNNC